MPALLQIKSGGRPPQRNSSILYFLTIPFLGFLAYDKDAQAEVRSRAIEIQGEKLYD